MKLPCADTCPSVTKHYRETHKPRFHITCLWCRTRRKRKLTRMILYGYLSMPQRYLQASQVDYEHGCTRYFLIKAPQTLLIDPAGHFTKLRCYAIAALDRLAVKLHLHSSHRIANICEFLANYPIW